MDMILKGDICYSKDPQNISVSENGYLVCENGSVGGVFSQIPEKYKGLPVTDHTGCIIIPGLCDLHTHAPQYSLRGLGMDMELLDWLSTYTYPEESKYEKVDYAAKSYGEFADALKSGATTRACVFATLHTPATVLLMEKLERTGIVTYVGKVNMDRNCPSYVRSGSAAAAYRSTRAWIEQTAGRFKRTSPILTPRFIPTCSDGLMRLIKELRTEYGLPVQSHLSESLSEIAWVRELCPWADCYARAYDEFGLFGGEGAPTVMAHCVFSEGVEEDLLRDKGVYVGHCPQSNINLSSGIAPVRRFMDKGIRVGLGSDVAGGCHLSILRAMGDAIQASKLYAKLMDPRSDPLGIKEAFYLGTVGGGSFFGKTGSFEAGYEFDAVVIDDGAIASPNPLTPEERLARVVYLSNESHILEKYVRGEQVYIKSAEGG